MATYKQPCIQCGELIDRNSHVCPKCTSRNPFGYHCPNCLKSIERGQVVCFGCSRNLYTICPFCNGQTFIGSERCDSCGRILMIQCENKRCGSLQFFENEKCTVCGKQIRNGRKQIDNMRKEGI